MVHYCDICDETIKINSKSKHLQSLSHNAYKERIHSKHTIESSSFFDIDEIFNEYVSNHNRNIVLYIVKYNFKLVFYNEFYPLVKSELRITQSKFLLEKFCYFGLNILLREDLNFLIFT